MRSEGFGVADAVPSATQHGAGVLMGGQKWKTLITSFG